MCYGELCKVFIFPVLIRYQNVIPGVSAIIRRKVLHVIGGPLLSSCGRNE